MSKTYETGHCPGDQIMDVTKTYSLLSHNSNFPGKRRKQQKHTNMLKMWYKYFSFIHFDDSFIIFDEICQKHLKLARSRGSKMEYEPKLFTLTA